MTDIFKELDMQPPTTPPAPSDPSKLQREQSGYWKPPAAQLPDSPVPKRSKKWIVLTITGVVVAGALAGGYIAYSKGYLAIPGLTPKTDQLFDKMVDSITDIKNAQYSIRLSIKGEPRNTKYTPLFPPTNGNANINASVSGLFKQRGTVAGVSTTAATNENVNVTANANANGNANSAGNTNAFVIEDIGANVGLGQPSSPLLGIGGFPDLNDYYSSLFQFIPSDINLSGGISIYFEADKKLSVADGSIRIDGSYTGSDISAAVDLEARKKGQDIYGIINKFPNLFIDIASIKGKWVHLNSDDSDWFDPKSLDEIDTREFIDMFKRIFKIALKEKLYTVKQKLPAETIAGVKSEHYLIKFDPTKLAPVFDAFISEERAKNSKNVNAYEDLRKSFSDPEYIALQQRLADNSRIEIWVDKVKGYLRQIKSDLVIVPPENVEKLKSKQFLVSTLLTMEKVNQKVSIDVPNDPIGMDEATRLLTGITKEQQQAEKQLDRVSSVRSMLYSYKSAKSAYPQSLDELTAYVQQKKDFCSANEATGTSQEKARDAKRKSDLRQLSLGLQSKADESPSFAYPAKLSDAASSFGTNTNSMPNDPSSNKEYGYTVCNSGKSFVLSTTLEAYDADKTYSLNENGVSQTGAVLTCGDTTAKSSTESDDCSYSSITYSSKSYDTTDLYTSKPFGYERTSDDFRLTYVVRLADLKDDYRKDYYADGTNTATSKDESTEKETSSEKYAREHPVNTNVNRNTNSNINLNTNTNTSSTVVSPVSTTELPRGSSNASITMVEYIDFESAFDAQHMNTMHMVMANYGSGVRWVVRQYPLESFHLQARAAAIGALCARKLGSEEQYWRYIEDLFAISHANSSKLSTELIAQAATNVGLNAGSFTSCTASSEISSQLAADKSSAETAGVSGVPTTFLIDKNGSVIATLAGAQPVSAFTSIIASYVTAGQKDTDNDGLNDDFERYSLWTDPNSDDTDKDGYKDKVEVDGGFNPTGAGKATADQLLRFGPF